MLGTNDRLQKLPSDVETAVMTETPASTTAAAAAGPSTTTDTATADVTGLLEECVACALSAMSVKLLTDMIFLQFSTRYIVIHSQVPQ